VGSVGADIGHIVSLNDDVSGEKAHLGVHHEVPASVSLSA
jgi:hypothetical protein